MGLVTKGIPATALWFGTGVHIALADWYDIGFHRGRKPWLTFRDWVGEEITEYVETTPNGFGEREFEDAKVLGENMLRGYVDLYGRDEDLETLAVEQPFQIELLDEDGTPIAIVAGTFDGVLYDHEDGEIYLWEHKTAKQIRTSFLALDDQAGTYYAVASNVLREQGILGPKEHIKGVLYNYLRKAKPDDRPQDERGLYLNKDGSISKNQPAAAYHREVIERNPGEVNKQLSRIRDEVKLMNAMRDGTMPVIKNTSYDCTFCQFFELCQLDEKGNKRAVRQYMKAAFAERDPYADHRKSAAE